jgi:amidohydrolase
MAGSNRVRAEIKKLSPAILDISRRIFDNPETNFNEIYASELLVGEFEKEGFKIKRGKGKLKTAFEAEFKGKSTSPAIAIMAEYDALPILGHACGHNMISAAAYGAAVAVKNVLGERCGTLKVLGTPAEEGGGGKILMIKDGWFKRLDAAIMVHPSNKTRVVARMLAVLDIEFHYYGKASHAAAHPELGVNALDAVINLFNAVNAMRQQAPNFSRVHGIITHGGDAPNIIPEHASAKFMVRGLTMPDFELMKKKLIKCARGSAESTGCRLEVKKNPVIFHPFEPNRALGRIFSRHLEDAGLEDCGMKETDEIGSSDIGNVSQVLPALHPEFAVGDGATAAVNHSREFLKALVSKTGKENLLKITEAMAGTVHELFTDPAGIKEARKEFNAFSKREPG